jgi:hypothetical protein
MRKVFKWKNNLTRMAKKNLLSKGKEKKEGGCGVGYGRGGCGGALYGLGFLGAAIYYISTASGFWMGVLGVLKALVWPAFLVFELLKFLGM